MTVIITNALQLVFLVVIFINYSVFCHFTVSDMNWHFTFRILGVNQSSPNHISDNARKPIVEATRQNSVSPVANSNHLNEVLRRQLAGDIRNRGPPPQPPSSRNNTTTVKIPSYVISSTF